MASPRVARAKEIADEISEALAQHDEFAGVYVGIDASKGEKHFRTGAVIVGLPALEFPSYGAVTAEWEIHIIAGPAANWIVAWDRIDEILEALLGSDLALTSAEAGAYQPVTPGASPLPAYTAKLND